MEKYKRIYRTDIEEIAPIVETVKKDLESNPVLSHVIPYELTFDEQNNDSVQVLAPNTTQTPRMSVDKAGPVAITELKGIATSASYMVNLYDSEYQRYISNRSLHAGTVIGTGIFPFKLPIPLILNRTQALLVDLTDISGAQNTIRHSYRGYRYYFNIEDTVFKAQSEANRISRPYFYTTDTNVSLADNNNIQSFKMTIINEANFMLHRITQVSSGAFRIRFRSLATGFSYTNGWVHSANFGGSSQNYSDIKPAMLLSKRSEIMFDFINLSGGINDVFLTFSGVNYYM